MRLNAEVIVPQYHSSTKHNPSTELLLQESSQGSRSALAGAGQVLGDGQDPQKPSSAGPWSPGARLKAARVSPQALDEEYLKVDAQFGGVDQRKIFTFAEKVRNGGVCEPPVMLAQGSGTH